MDIGISWLMIGALSYFYQNRHPSQQEVTVLAPEVAASGAAPILLRPLQVPMAKSQKGLVLGKEIQAIRGMNDILPEQMPYWHRLEQACRDVVGCCGFAEIRVPVLEQTDLFARSIGGDTDIVAKEMYTFADRNGDSLTLRPEGTAGCVRSGIDYEGLQKCLSSNERKSRQGRQCSGSHTA